MNIQILYNVLGASSIALFSTIIFIKFLIPLAKRLEFVDRPGGRKHHHAPIPLVGGVAMFLAFALGILLLQISLAPYRILFGCACILVFTGVLDDFRELTPRFRLFVQFFCALLIIIFGHIVLTDLGNLLPLLIDLQVSFTIGAIITIFAVIGVINAVNMLDGVDGLLGSITLIQLGMLVYLALIANLMAEVSIIFVLMATLLGYLYYNFPLPWRRHAVVFMGDAGSMFLGFMLVWLMIYLSQEPHRAASPAVFLWVMAVPLFDIGSLIIRRPLNKRSPFNASRDHIHHLLQALGFNKLAIVLFLSLISIIFGLIGIVGSHYQISSRWLFLGLIIVFVCYTVIVEGIWRKLKLGIS